jgi:hypothetical protein
MSFSEVQGSSPFQWSPFNIANSAAAAALPQPSARAFMDEQKFYGGITPPTSPAFQAHSLIHAPTPKAEKAAAREKLKRKAHPAPEEQIEPETACKMDMEKEDKRQKAQKAKPKEVQGNLLLDLEEQYTHYRLGQPLVVPVAADKAQESFKIKALFHTILSENRALDQRAQNVGQQAQGLYLQNQSFQLQIAHLQHAVQASSAQVQPLPPPPITRTTIYYSNPSSLEPSPITRAVTAPDATMSGDSQ